MEVGAPASGIAFALGAFALTPRQGKNFRTSDQVGDLAVTQLHAAGL
jgi:hypothetical protein